MVQSYIKTLNPLDALLKPINLQLQEAIKYAKEQQNAFDNNQEYNKENVNVIEKQEKEENKQ